MSNYLSQPVKYAAPPTDANFELLSKVALMQQQKYDVNHQQVQQTLDAFGAMKTLRPEDDAYIASKLNSITTQANAMGGNLANQSISSQFISKIKGAAQDPTILNAMEQTKKMAAAQAQIAEYKKKDPNLVNEKNYKDMLESAGYTDYMEGKTDKLGSLTYNPFVDIATSLHKKAADFSKEKGLKDEYLTTENGTFETVDKFGNKVTEQEIQQYLYSSMSDAERTQMQINARADYKNMPQANFDKLLLEDANEKKSALENGLAKLKAEAASKSESEKGQYAQLIAETDRKITLVKDKVAKGTFDKSEMYDYYAKDVISGVASNYDILRVTKIDRNDLPFEIMKFEKETALKEQELSLKKTEMQQAQSSSLGTATTIPTEIEEQKSTGLQVVRKNVQEADAALDGYLKKVNSDGYNNMSPSEQWTYKVHLKLNKPTIAGANATLKTLTDNFSAAQTNYAKVINNAKPKLAKATQENYDNLIGGGGLKVENLASTMPLTAELLKSKRTFTSLSKEEQLGVVTEFAASNLQYNDSLQGDVRTVYERVVDANKAELAKSGTSRAKQVRKVIAGSTGKEEVGGYWSNLGNRFAGAANVVLGVPLHMIGKGAAYGWNSLVNGSAVADAEYKDWDKTEKDMLRYRDQSVKNYDKFSKDYFGGEDTNITELESQDLRLKGGKPSMGVVDSFNAVNAELETSINAATGSFMENQKETRAFTFSLDDKAQKGVGLAIKAAVLANGTPIENSVTDFTVARSGEQFKVSYPDKKGEKMITVLIPKLPDAVTNVIDTSSQNWNNSPLNPNISLAPVTINQYKDSKTRDVEAKAAIDNVPMSREQRIAMLTNPGNTAFATIPEIRDKVKQVYSPAFYEQNKAQIENILNTSYKAVPYVEGGAFYYNLEYSENGEAKTYYSPSPAGAVKDEYAFYFQYLEAAARVRDTRIKALTNK